MKKSNLYCLLLFLVCLYPAHSFSQNSPVAEIITDYGVIKVRLSELTPLHTANFVKLTGEGFYNNTLFHRVIKNFMIQGGDPDSKNALPGQELGNGDVGYTIPAEFNDSLFHKKGALCAARDDNPEKASSGCQFYIVQGKIFTDPQLDQLEAKINMQRKQSAVNNYLNRPENTALKEQFLRLQKENQKDSLLIFSQQILDPAVDKPALFHYTSDQRRIYKTTGGTPHLDQGYTVFGQVIEGLDVIDKIADQPTGKNDRPEKDIKMTIRLVQ